jgi:hypothetical protein
MKELKNLQVELVSILTDDILPANEEAIVIKDKGYRTKGHFEVTKFNEIEGLLEVIVYRANKVDTQGDYISNDELEKAVEWNLNFLIRKGKNEPSDVNHSFEIAEGVKLLQTYVDKSEENWIWRQKLDIKGNPALMEKAKLKTINGVSLAGTAETIEAEKGMVKSIYDMIKEIFNKKKESEMTREEIEAIIDERLASKTEEVQETSEETPETEAPETEPENNEVEEIKATLTEMSEKYETLKAELETVKKARVTKEEEVTPDPQTLDDVIAEKMDNLMKKYKEQK